MARNHDGVPRMAYDGGPILSVRGTYKRLFYLSFTTVHRWSHHVTVKMRGFKTLGALLACITGVHSDYTQAYTNVSDPYYGQSSPIYPTPEGTGGVDAKWQTAYAQARSLVANMTLDERSNLTRGFTGNCIGVSGSVERLGIQSLCISDAPSGIRGQEFVSAFPSQIHVGATFDKDLMYRYGEAIGREYRGKGIKQALLPVAGPLGRLARGGRNWEGFGADPYLSGVAMYAETLGVQDQGVIATAKHFLLNEQEYRRLPGHAGEAISANADDRTTHELYVFPFMDALRAGSASVLCSYQRVNNSYACQNSKLMNGILKTELGFQGYVTSDSEQLNLVAGSGQHSGVASANAGLDLVMPDGGFWGNNLTEAVRNGSVSESRLNDMATRILAAQFYLGQDEGFPDVSTHTYDVQAPIVDVRADHASLIREIGSAGTVLVKNVNNALPLKRPRYVSVYGYDAKLPDSPWTNPLRFGGGYEVNYGWTTFNGTLVVGGGSGSNAPPYVVAPFQAIQDRVIKDSGILRWDFDSVNSTVYANTEACLVFVNAYASESFDRTALTDDFSDQLVRNVATNCSNTIVIVHSAGIRVVDDWIEHPNVTAVVFGLLPGQKSGNALVDVLYGDVSPSGRLPFTVARNESDYGHLLNSTVTAGPYPQQNFTEGLYIDYRYFDKYNVTPRFEFGYGLSYASFEYSNLTVIATGSDISPYPADSSVVPQGGPAALWDTIFDVKVTIQNVGNITAPEVPQLYVGIPAAPERQLRGFERVVIGGGGCVEVNFALTRKDLSVWDVFAQKWKLQNASYPLFVGASSRDIRLTGQLVV